MRRVLSLSVLVLALAAPAAAGQSAPAPGQGTAPDPDLQLNRAEPDFTLGALPTTLRMPSGKFSFRLTHRFSRPIASGSAGDFFADFFGFDSPARIGFELRYGVRPGTQATVLRTNDRTIQFLGQHEIAGQAPARPFSTDVIVAIEPADNFSESFATTVGGAFSHRFAERGAVYVQPLVVFNAYPAGGITGDSRHTLMLGVGARLRLGDSRTYVVVEAAPEVAGYSHGVDHVSVGIERRAGGHLFQLVLANSLGATLRQIARGGFSEGDWYLGFNLTRKFY